MPSLEISPPPSLPAGSPCRGSASSGSLSWPLSLPSNALSNTCAVERSSPGCTAYTAGVSCDEFSFILEAGTLGGLTLCRIPNPGISLHAAAQNQPAAVMAENNMPYIITAVWAWLFSSGQFPWPMFLGVLHSICIVSIHMMFNTFLPNLFLFFTSLVVAPLSTMEACPLSKGDLPIIRSQTQVISGPRASSQFSPATRTGAPHDHGVELTNPASQQVLKIPCRRSYNLSCVLRTLDDFFKKRPTSF